MILSNALRRKQNETILTLDDPTGWRTGGLLSHNGSKSSSLKISAVSACVDVITNSLAKFPQFVMNRDTKEHPRHPLSSVLSLRPNEAMTPTVFKRLMETYRLLWGNAYALPVRSAANGRVTEIIPLPADYVVPYLSPEDGTLWYIFTNPKSGERRKFRSWDIVHLKNFSYDGITGASVLSRAADVIATAQAAQIYENKFYTQSARPAGVLRIETGISGDAKDKIREEWHKIYGGVDNSFRVAVLDLGVDYKQIGISNADAQFVEGKTLTVEDIGRFFGVPLYKINVGKQSYSSNEQNAIEYVVNTLHPIVEQWEEELTYKLLFDTEIERGLEIRINMMAELRGDFASRGQWYKNMRESGAFSVDDILALEDMPPVDGGDVRLASLNFVPLDAFRDLSIARNKAKGGTA